MSQTTIFHKIYSKRFFTFLYKILFFEIYFFFENFNISTNNTIGVKAAAKELQYLFLLGSH
jgi:hypothetical protein